MAKSFMEHLIEASKNRQEAGKNPLQEVLYRLSLDTAPVSSPSEMLELLQMVSNGKTCVVIADEDNIGVLRYLATLGWKPPADPVEFLAKFKSRVDALDQKITEHEKTVTDLRQKLVDRPTTTTGIDLAANQLTELQQFRNARDQIIDLLKRKNVISQSTAYAVLPHTAVNAIAQLVDQLDQHKDAYQKAHTELQAFKQKLIDLAEGSSSLGGEADPEDDDDDHSDME